MLIPHSNHNGVARKRYPRLHRPLLDNNLLYPQLQSPCNPWIVLHDPNRPSANDDALPPLHASGPNIAIPLPQSKHMTHSNIVQRLFLMYGRVQRNASCEAVGDRRDYAQKYFPYPCKTVSNSKIYDSLQILPGSFNFRIRTSTE